MEKGILYVETRPSSEAEAAEYHKWYEQVHIPEMLGLDGFASVRRFQPLDGDGPFVAIYEIEAENIDAVRESQREGSASGHMSPPQAVQMDPPPVTRYFKEIYSGP